MQKELLLDKKSTLKEFGKFSLPFLLANILQTLYGMADLFMVGRFNSSDSISAVSIGSQVMHMVTLVILGLAVGSTVIIAQAKGKGDKDKIKRGIGNTMLFFFLFSLVLTIILLLLRDKIVLLLSTPTEAIEKTKSYLLVCFIGIPFITFYNVISSIFRGLGDSKSPMKYAFIACVTNIVLDYILVGIVKLGPIGAATATVIAQGVSVIFSLRKILSSKMEIKLEKKDFKLKGNVVADIFKVGLPIAIQDALIQVAFISITVIANKRGLLDSASVGIVEKIIGIVFLVPSTLLSTVSSLSSIALGQGNRKKAKDILYISLIISTIFGILIALIVEISPESFVGIFNGEKDPEILRRGGEYLSSYIWDCLFAGWHFSFSGYFSALTLSYLSFIHNIIAIALVRIPLAFYLSNRYPLSLRPMGMAAPLGSLLSAAICVIMFFKVEKKRKKDE